MRKNMFKTLAVLVIPGLVALGCNTVTSGTTRTLKFTSEDGRNVQLTVASEDKVIQTVTTPGSIDVSSRSGKLTVTVTDPCYNETQTVLKSKVKASFFGGITMSGVTGSTTDAASGAMWDYDDNIVVPVEKNNKCVSAPAKKPASPAAAKPASKPASKTAAKK